VSFCPFEPGHSNGRSFARNTVATQLLLVLSAGEEVPPRQAVHVQLPVIST
jgi:hypothetical protein